MNIPDGAYSANCGVPISVARANGWILKDASGNDVHYGGCGSDNSYLADIGNPSYQAEFVKDVVAV